MYKLISDSYVASRAQKLACLTPSLGADRQNDLQTIRLLYPLLRMHAQGNKLIILAGLVHVYIISLKVHIVDHDRNMILFGTDSCHSHDIQAPSDPSYSWYTHTDTEAGGAN